MRIFVIKMRKSYYWTLAAVLVIGLFWYTDFLSVVDIPVSGVAPYYHGSAERMEMALTVNVDWGEEYIPLMLEIFKVKGVKATFFFTANSAQKYPDLVRRIYAAGHEIGNHGYSHVHPNQLSRAGLIEHVRKCEETIYGITGVRTSLYAPPYGEYNKSVVSTVDELGYKLIMWSADTIDWQKPTPEVINQRIMKKASNGGIVLMHPVYQTVQALPQMIDGLKSKGYRLVTVSEVLKTSGQGE